MRISNQRLLDLLRYYHINSKHSIRPYPSPTAHNPPSHYRDSTVYIPRARPTLLLISNRTKSKKPHLPTHVYREKVRSKKGFTSIFILFCTDIQMTLNYL